MAGFMSQCQPDMDKGIERSNQAEDSSMSKAGAETRCKDKESKPQHKLLLVPWLRPQTKASTLSSPLLNPK